MTQTNPPELSIDEICTDARLWCAIGDEICHRGGPASYIELEFDVASNAARSGPQTYWDTSIAPEIERAENEATKYGYRCDVVQAIIKGYRKLIASYKESRDYFYANLHSDDSFNAERDMIWFTSRIKEHQKRIQQLADILKKKK